MTIRTTVAAKALQSALEKESLPPHKINEESDAYAAGFLWRVVLSWPGKKSVIEEEVQAAKKATEHIADQYGYKLLFYGPIFVTGGALAVLCGLKEKPKAS